MKTYIGIARRGAQGLEIFPQYELLDNGDLKPEKLKAFQHEDKDGLIGIVKIDYNGKNVVKVSRFPHARDSWHLAIERASVDVIKNSGQIGPWATLHPAPASSFFVLHKDYMYGPLTPQSLKKINNNLFLPVIPHPEADDTKVSADRVVRFKKSEKAKQDFYLLLIRKKVSTAAVESPQTASSTTQEFPAPATEGNKAESDAEMMFHRMLRMGKSAFKLFFPRCVAEKEEDADEAHQLLQQCIYAHKALVILQKEKETAVPLVRGIINQLISDLEIRLNSTKSFISRQKKGLPEQQILFLSELLKLLNILDETKLYEYYCFYRLIDKFLECGFATNGSSFRHAYGNAPLPENETGLANTVCLRKDGAEATLYFQPRISGSSIENDIGLYRRNEESCLTPDFVVKLSIGDRKDYIILDAKLAQAQNVRGYFTEVVTKYALQLQTQNDDDRIAMVWTLQGRKDNILHFSGFDSPMEKEFAGTRFPSFGNCTVNEKSPEGMDAFWDMFNRLLPPAT